MVDQLLGKKGKKMCLFIVIKYPLLPSSDTYSYTETCHIHVCLSSAPINSQNIIIDGLRCCYSQNQAHVA